VKTVYAMQGIMLFGRRYILARGSMTGKIVWLQWLNTNIARTSCLVRRVLIICEEAAGLFLKKRES
jgi:hypothetical protein